jgi:hypothetical protein
VREAVSDLQEALARRCGVAGVWGKPLRRLERIALEANGELARVVAAAGAPGGPDKLLERIGYLEGIMTSTPPVAERPAPEQEVVYIEAENRWALRNVDRSEQDASTVVATWPAPESEPSAPTS